MTLYRNSDDSAFTHGRRLLEEAIEATTNEVIASDGISRSRLLTGYRDYDLVTGGWRSGDVHVLGSRSCGGGEELTRCLVHRFLTADRRVAVVSLRHSKTAVMVSLMKLALNAPMHIPATELATIMSPDSLTSLTSHFEGLRICDLKRPDFGQLGRQMVGGKVDCIIVEFSAGLLADICVLSEGRPCVGIDALSLLAARAEVPLLVSVPLPAWSDARPGLGDFPGLLSVEQQISTVQALHRDEFFFSDSPEPGIAELIILKNRYGSADTVKLRYDASSGMFADLM